MKVAYKRKEKTKGISLWAYASLIVITTVVLSFQNPPEPKKYKFEMTLQDINTMIYCIEQSAAPAQSANMIIKEIASQVNPQLAEDQKKIQDSINKAKPKQ
jgi:hypothetical protein